MAGRRCTGWRSSSAASVLRLLLPRDNCGVNALNIAEYMQTMGARAREASAAIARTDAATKNTALRTLAAKLRANVEPLQAENARDVQHATSQGLSAPMVDRLKLTP